MIAPTSYAAHILWSIAHLLANSAAFRSATGSPTASDALARICLFDGGQVDDAGTATAADGSTFVVDGVTCWAHVASDPFDVATERPSNVLFTRNGTLTTRLWYRANPADLAPDRLTAFLNLLGACAEQMQDPTNAATIKPPAVHCTVGLDYAPDEASGMHRYLTGRILTTWSDLP